MLVDILTIMLTLFGWFFVSSVVLTRALLALLPPARPAEAAA